MAENKYIVFKYHEFFELMGELALPEKGDCAVAAERIIQRAQETAVSDAVVIRRQDVFSPPALDAYASSIQCVIEALNVSKPSLMSTGMAHELQGIADYFHQQATLAWNAKRKMPD